MWWYEFRWYEFIILAIAYTRCTDIDHIPVRLDSSNARGLIGGWEGVAVTQFGGGGILRGGDRCDL